uniref:Uncharacterized protein n=1 Tax=Arundo donax TaxID=35708 RepID=A0A0A8YAZ9_ARUDO
MACRTVPVSVLRSMLPQRAIYFKHCWKILTTCSRNHKVCPHLGTVITTSIFCLGQLQLWCARIDIHRRRNLN